MKNKKEIKEEPIEVVKEDIGFTGEIPPTINKDNILLEKQIANFIIRVTDAGITFKSVSSNWDMTITTFNPLYAAFLPLLQIDKYNDYIGAYILVNYLSANMNMDMEFINDFMDIYDKAHKRIERIELSQINDVVSEVSDTIDKTKQDERS